VSGCQRNGGAKFSAAAARRGEGASPFSFRQSTPAPDSSSQSEDQRFTRRQRITRGADLQSIAREGKRLRTAFLDVRVVVTSRPQSRLGFVVPKHGHSAVRRNRLKRTLRELARRVLVMRLRATKTGSSMDIVMRTLPAAYTASFGALRAEFDSLSARLLRLGDGSSHKIEREDVSGSSSTQ
jgi:ribonuclease P protein component